MILERLKKETAKNHMLVEESGLMSPIGNKTLNKQEYIHILSKFYGFFNPLEKLVLNQKKLVEYLPDLSERRKSECIIHDLKALGVEDELQFSKELPSVSNADEAFGALYVMEGSTLGGAIISRTVADILGYQKETGCSFFAGYGPETGSKWKGFREALLSYTEKEGNEDVIIAAADETFEKFRKWIETLR